MTVGISSTDDRVEVSTTKGFPDEYGLFKIGDEIITYTGKTATSFTDVLGVLVAFLPIVLPLIQKN